MLENVQYTPTRSRYKIYLIDEVHMLSNHSFNALLKTLENLRRMRYFCWRQPIRRSCPRRCCHVPAVQSEKYAAGADRCSSGAGVDC